MKHVKLSCCYFPTTIAFIDDKESFLQNTSIALRTNFNQKLFSKVAVFKEFLLNHPSQLQQYDWMHSADDSAHYPSHGQHDISINFHLICKQIENKNRYDELSVAIVDYAMPECNGVELCRFIKQQNPCIQTLLLTGEADHKIAVDAFNNKLIDKFILKQKGAAFIQDLTEVINELSQAYFVQTFDRLNMNLTGNNPLLHGQPFLELFNATYQQHNACEYYLIDPAGSYLMLNKIGEPQWLIIKNQEDVQTYCELATSEEKLDAKTLKRIENKQCIPFYHGEYLNLPEPNHWHEHLLDAETITDNAFSYPYAIFSGFEHTIIKVDEVQSLQAYQTAAK